MAWFAALSTASKIGVGFAAVTTAMQVKQAGAAGKYNQDVQNRNAEVSRQQGDQIIKQAEFDIAQFDKDFTKIQSTAKKNILKSGVTLEGSGLRILRANAEEAELQRQTIRYNAEVGKANAIEKANFYTMQGNIARQQATSAQLGAVSRFGGTLLSLAPGKSPTPQPQYIRSELGSM